MVEARRPVAAWDLVLEEMKWLSADFRQERIWKKSAARVCAAAAKEAVVARQTVAAARLEDGLAARAVARSLAEQVAEFWGNVAALHEYETERRTAIFSARLIGCQLEHVSELQEWDNNCWTNSFLISILKGFLLTFLMIIISGHISFSS